MTFGIDLLDLLRSVGYPGIFAIIFAESGLLVGIILPGDSLLFSAGILSASGVFNFPLLVLIAVAAAIAGDAVGYTFGKRVGRRLFERPDSRWFKREYLHRAEAFYERHGSKALVLARFIPIVRTLVPIVAGVGAMEYRRFATFNALGGVLWGAGITTMGYVAGNTIPNIDRYLLPVILLIILLSAAPTALEMLRHRSKA